MTERIPERQIMEKLKSKFNLEKDFIVNYLKLAAALMLQQAIVLSVNLLDNIMIGGYSENALAGVAIVNQMHFLFNGFFIGITMGMAVLASQYWGKKDRDSIEHLTSTCTYLAFFFGIVVFALLTFIPGELVSCFTKDGAVAAEALSYIKAIRWSYPVFAITTILLASLRSVGVVRIAVIVSVISLFINCGCNYTLIFGHFGAPELGSYGAAIATTIARVIEFGIVLFYTFRLEKNIRFKFKNIIKIDFSNLPKIIKVCTPTLIAEISFCTGQMVQGIVLGNLSTTALAANSIASSLYQLVKVMGVGASNAAAVAIGQAVPKGKDYSVKCCNTLQVVFICIGIAIAAVLALVCDPVVSMYKVAPETAELARSFIRLLCVIGLCMSYQMSCDCGIIAGGGEPSFVMKMDLCMIWLVVIPLSFLAAFKFGWPPILVVLCLNIDQILKVIPASIKTNSHTWYKDLTK